VAAQFDQTSLKTNPQPQQPKILGQRGAETSPRLVRQGCEHGRQAASTIGRRSSLPRAPRVSRGKLLSYDEAAVSPAEHLTGPLRMV